ncbi:MATE efflux family protein [Methanococcus vannielii SB]|uniref:Multidrug export protein MepA n=1 Tax=Methanococcus vannielii (strain ATCC 35089 / DSM 1224 / JCM 13029 / OCM 148 / SB) TaxID=406327 RepID=A6URK1_METVS|nr:MATE family efflux transporter [Methanococcus vannielii]ABR55123.1 MATE efflux family protein [Methanococcus vannielii SB]
MKNTELATESINKLILKYALPSTIGFVVLGIYIIVDGIFLGNYVGSDAIAAVTVAIPFSFLLTGFGLMFGIGASSHISMNLGAGNQKDAENILKTVFYLIFITGIILTLLSLIFIKPLLALFGVSENLLNLSYDYLNLIYLFGIFIMFKVGLDPIIRNDGFPKKAMYAIILSSLLNILFDAIFIVIFGWGVFGAALASVIGETFGALIYIHHFLAGKSNLKIKLFEKVSDIKYEIKNVKKILSVGFSPFILEMSASIVMLIHTIQFLRYGNELDVSAYGIVSYIFAIIMLIFIGLGNGVQPIISYNFGAKEYFRVKEIIRTSSILCSIVGILVFLLFSIFPKIPVMLFNQTDSLLIETSIFGLRYFAYGLSVFGLNYLIITYFQSIGNSIVSNTLSLIRVFVFLIPLLIILPKNFGINGIWASQPLAEILTLIVGFIFIKVAIKRTLNTVNV